MNYLVMHPEKGLCIVRETSWYDLETAMSAIPEIATELVEQGDIRTDITFVEDECYVGEPTLKFYINTPSTYPDKYEQEVMYDTAGQYHSTVLSRTFGSYTLATYSTKAYDRFYAGTRLLHPDWSFVPFKKPVPEMAVCDEKEIIESSEDMLSDIPEMDLNPTVPLLTGDEQDAEENKEPEPAVVESSTTANPVDVTPAPIKEVIHVDTSAPDLSIFVPEECRGETWAFTDEVVNLSDVEDNGYCIENNWDNRGLYWLIDCVPRGVRLIHSDTLAYTKEFKIEQCGE